MHLERYICVNFTKYSMGRLVNDVYFLAFEVMEFAITPLATLHKPLTLLIMARMRLQRIYYTYRNISVPNYY